MFRYGALTYGERVERESITECGSGAQGQSPAGVGVTGALPLELKKVWLPYV